MASGPACQAVPVVHDRARIDARRTNAGQGAAGATPPPLGKSHTIGLARLSAWPSPDDEPRLQRHSDVGARPHILIAVRKIERVQRTSAAGNWMVGPPSSWSRDQEDSIWAGPVNGPLARPCVCRPDATTCSRYGTPGSRSDDWRGSSPRGARRRFHSTSRLIAGTSRPHDTLLQLGGRFVDDRLHRRRDALQDRVALLIVWLFVSTAWEPRARLSARRTDAPVARRQSALRRPNPGTTTDGPHSFQARQLRLR